MSIEEIVEDVENSVEDFVEDVEAFVDYVADEITDFFLGEDDEDYPPCFIEDNGDTEEVTPSAESTPFSIKLTPEQQKWFQDTTERLHKENEELKESIQNHREWKAKNMAPNYGGLISTDED